MNVKPKDLAMVVDAPPPWAGATCTVVKSAPDPRIEVYAGIAGPYWLVEMARPMLVFSISRQVEKMSHEAYLPDSMLRKIGGPDIETRSFEEIAGDHLRHSVAGEHTCKSA